MEPLGAVQFQFLRIPMWTLPFAQMGGETNEGDCDGAFFAPGCRGRVDVHRFSGLQYELRGASSAHEHRELQPRKRAIVEIVL